MEDVGAIRREKRLWGGCLRNEVYRPTTFFLVRADIAERTQVPEVKLAIAAIGRVVHIFSRQGYCAPDVRGRRGLASVRRENARVPSALGHRFLSEPDSFMSE